MKCDRRVKAKRALARVNEATVSIDQAIAAVSQIGGTIFDIRLKEVDGRIIWRIKMVRESERVKVNVDAKSALILDAKADMGVDDMEKSYLTA